MINQSQSNSSGSMHPSLLSHSGTPHSQIARLEGPSAWAVAVFICGLVLIQYIWVHVAVAQSSYTDGQIIYRGPEGGGFGQAGKNQSRLDDAILIWRRSAWQEADFLSAVELGEQYGMTHRPRAVKDELWPNPYFDPVESYVWFFMATHASNYTEYISDGKVRNRMTRWFQYASNRQVDLLLKMTQEQRQEARSRIIYVLSSRNAHGFIRLGQIHTPLPNPGTHVCGEGWQGPRRPSDSTCKAIDAVHEQMKKLGSEAAETAVTGEKDTMEFSGLNKSMPDVIARDVGSAYTYFTIANAMGHPLARNYMTSLQPSALGTQNVNVKSRFAIAEFEARNWVPPFEYYPPGAGPLPLTDEGIVSEPERVLLLQVEKAVPTKDRVRALWYLTILPNYSDVGKNELTEAYAKFQRQLRHPVTGQLTPAEILRLIRMAAKNGDANSQVRLGIMYAKGQAVAQNIRRAQNWLMEAYNQRDGRAMYYLAQLIDKGYIDPGRDITASVAVSLITQSAFAGFPKARERVQHLVRGTPITPTNRVEVGRPSEDELDDLPARNGAGPAKP